MGYHIKPITSVAVDEAKRAASRTWKLQYVKMQDGVRRARDIPEAEYRSHGFLPSMTIEQARRHKKIANEKYGREESAVRQIEAAKRVSEKERAHFLYLNESDVRAFEGQILFRRLSRGDQGLHKRNKLISHWNTVKDYICELKVDPSDWVEESWKFYNYFGEKKYALSYLQKLLRIQNAWGAFISRKNGKYFMPLSWPKGMDRAFIANANNAKRKELRKKGHKVQGPSAPLTPELLRKSKINFTKIENYNWLFISLWFGLRPNEIDMLKVGEFHRVEYDRKVKHHALWVYQSKLVTLPEEQRWKAIPAIYKEQSEALEIIASGLFDHPSPMTIREGVGNDFTAYAGRKGFEDLMCTVKGHPLEVVAEWMGHQSIERTWKNYRNRKRVRV